MMARRVGALSVMVALLPIPVIADDVPFGRAISPADRKLVMKLTKSDPADVNPETDLKIAKIDLNEDGRPDYVVVIEGGMNCGSAGCPTSVYLSNGDQYRNVLPDLYAQGIALGTGSTQRVRDLSLELHGQSGWSRWVWNGKVYRPAAEGTRK
jgi:hypothetical protein